MTIKVGDAVVNIRGDIRDLKKSMREAQGSVEGTFKKIEMAVAAVGAVIAGNQFIGKINEALDAFTLFESAIADLGKVDVTNFKEVGEQMLAMPAAFGKSADLAKAYYQVISSGVRDQEKAKVVLEDTAKATKAANDASITHAQVIKVTTGLMNVYTDELKGSADALDLLFQIENKGRTSFAELVPVIGEVAAMAKVAGVSVEDMAGGLATVTQIAGSTSQASTALRAVFTQLIKPTTEMKEAFAELGVTSGKALIEQNGLSVALQKLNDYAKKSGKQLADLLGSQEAVVGVTALMSDKFKVLDDSIKGMGGRAGSLDRAWTNYSKTMKALKDELASVFDKIKIGIGALIAPTVTEKMNWLVDTFKDTDRWVTLLTSTIEHASKILVAWTGYIIANKIAVAGLGTTVNALKALEMGKFLASYAVSAGSASEAFEAMNTVLWGTKASLLSVKGALAGLFSFIAGWEIGKWLTENFEEARLAGVAMVDGVMTAWIKLKTFGKEVWSALDNIIGDIFINSLATAADMITAVGKALAKLGKTDLAKSFFETAMGIRKTTQEMEAHKNSIEDIVKAGEDELKQKDKIIDELRDEAVHYKGASTAGEDAAKKIAEAQKKIEAQLKKTNVEFKDLNTTAGKSATALGKVKAGAQGIETSFSSIQGDFASMSSEMESFVQGSQALGTSFKSVQSDFESMNEEFEQFSAIQRDTNFGAVQSDFESMNAEIENTRGIIDIAGDKFHAFSSGVIIEYDKMKDASIDWANVGSEAFSTFHNGLQGAFKESFVDILKGDFDKIDDAWKDLWDGMLDTFINTLAEMAAKWAAEKVVSGVVSIAGSLFHSGTGIGEIPFDSYPATLQQGETVLPKYISDLIKQSDTYNDLSDSAKSTISEYFGWDQAAQHPEQYSEFSTGGTIPSEESYWGKLGDYAGWVAAAYNAYSAYKAFEEGNYAQGTVSGAAAIAGGYEAYGASTGAEVGAGAYSSSLQGGAGGSAGAMAILYGIDAISGGNVLSKKQHSAEYGPLAAAGVGLAVGTLAGGYAGAIMGAAAGIGATALGPGWETFTLDERDAYINAHRWDGDTFEQIEPVGSDEQQAFILALNADSKALNTLIGNISAALTQQDREKFYANLNSGVLNVDTSTFGAEFARAQASEKIADILGFVWNETLRGIAASIPQGLSIEIPEKFRETHILNAEGARAMQQNIADIYYGRMLQNWQLATGYDPTREGGELNTNQQMAAAIEQAQSFSANGGRESAMYAMPTFSQSTGTSIVMGQSNIKQAQASYNDIFSYSLPTNPETGKISKAMLDKLSDKYDYNFSKKNAEGPMRINFETHDPSAIKSWLSRDFPDISYNEWRTDVLAALKYWDVPGYRYGGIATGSDIPGPSGGYMVELHGQEKITPLSDVTAMDREKIALLERIASGIEKAAAKGQAINISIDGKAIKGVVNRQIANNFSRGNTDGRVM